VTKYKIKPIFNKINSQKQKSKLYVPKKSVR